MMGWLKNDLWFWEMFNKHTVVVGNIYSMYTKMGVGKRPDATVGETCNDG